MQKEKSIIVIIIVCIIIGMGAISVLVNKNTYAEKKDETCALLTARELNEHMFFNWTYRTEAINNDEYPQIEFKLDKNQLILLYLEFFEGDCIIINDTISIIEYYPDYKYTTICFSWYKDQYTKIHEYYYFNGDITDIYNEGDTIKIPLHLKHLEVETANTSYNIYVFEEQWQSEKFFRDNVEDFLIQKGLKPMDPDIIIKS